MQMNKKGFVFIETILTIVVLTTTLVILYTNYSRAVIAERRRLYYDDISYVYKTSVIRDILDQTVNPAQWDAKVEEVLAKQYIYVFNINSQIFTDNSLISSARNVLNYNQLIYIPMAMVPTVKRCINGEINSKKCERTLTIIDGYSDATFKDYLKAIYVPEPVGGKINGKTVKGILISLIYETKDGNSAIPNGAYESCLQHAVFEHKYPNKDDRDRLTDEQKKEILKEYQDDGSYSVDMKCENAYYNSWVYL